MRLMLMLSIALLPSAGFSKEIAERSPQYSDVYSWEVGDKIENLGTVERIEVKGQERKITIKGSDGITFDITANFKESK